MTPTSPDTCLVFRRKGQGLLCPTWNAPKEFAEHMWNRLVFSANPFGLWYLVVVPPKRAGIKAIEWAHKKKKSQEWYNNDTPNSYH